MLARLQRAVAPAALVVAVLGWTPLGEAAREAVFPPNSVGTDQLKTNAVTSPKIRNGSVQAIDIQKGTITNVHIKPASLLASSFKPGQLPTGPKGDKGDRGDKGAKGDPGIVKAHEVFRLGTLDSTATKVVTVMCPAGEIALGGGFNIGRVEAQPPVTVLTSIPITDATDTTKTVGWRVEAAEIGAYANDWRPVAVAVCAPAS